MVEESDAGDVEDATARLLAWLGTTALEAQLARAAQSACRRALAATGDWIESTLQAGLAVEFLAKAIVFRDNPASLTRASKASSVAFLTGAGHRDVHHLGQVFTILGREAVDGACLTLNIGPPNDSDVCAAFEARNSAVHIGYADNSTAPGAIGAAFRLVEQLLSAQNIAVEAWLGDPVLARVFGLLAALPIGRESAHRAREAIVRAAVWRAQQVVADIKRRVAPDVWLSMATQPRDSGWTEHRELHPCPAGDHLAWYSVYWEASDTQDSEDPENLVDEIGMLGGLECGLCGLDLADDETLLLGFAEIVGYRTIER